MSVGLWNVAWHFSVVTTSSGHLSLLLFPPPTMGKLKHLLRLTHLQGLIGILDILMLEKVEQPFVIPDGELENIMVPSSEKKRTHKKGKKSAVPGVMTPDQLDDSGFASSLHIAEPGERFGLKKNPIPLSYVNHAPILTQRLQEGLLLNCLSYMHPLSVGCSLPSHA
ncbi:hypothetical protein BDR04DRAFT_1118323 [Suillus decipiens]|nr:hypothetical protein BDR04DRAFT_1118323 [Suillus decipiens]